MKTTIRILAVFATLIWAIAAVRVWADAHNPYTTMLCVILATMSAATTIKPELILWENEEGNTK
ncbi:hypothetical protein [Trueperella pyogenes]|uniref:hypothetical protein n=1 Tax=Trueperella pyogenes TaxID=1661 RepID=UPI0024BFF2A2|nr:hypothetical protein [Trueperella pyogenes]WHU57078.1 hypothetical protein QEV10_10165 [Trueperella pyogenes]